MESRIARRSVLQDPRERLKRMLEIRKVEQTIQVLFNDGLVRGSTHLCIGQEAVAVGIAAATMPTDVVTCTYRGHGAALALGVTPEEVLGEICGRVTGCAGGLGGSMHLVGTDVGLFPTNAIVGAGLPIAAGAALTFQITGVTNVAVAVCGDGATNIGAFHESLNLASIWKLPIIFVIENNLYGEYSRIDLTTPIEDLADRAASYGLPSVIVDGQDVNAVVDAVATAGERARQGEGPTLLEMKTYRYSGHSRSDAATYRPEGELDDWKKRDPIAVMASQLGLSSEAIEELESLVAEEVDAALSRILESKAPGESEMFAHVYGGP
jgi:TPP-dependent pyruvate/acetoin dehydrogenase alpha subunit